jgi:hypothetical protein
MAERVTLAPAVPHAFVARQVYEEGQKAEEFRGVDVSKLERTCRSLAGMTLSDVARAATAQCMESVRRARESGRGASRPLVRMPGCSVDRSFVCLLVRSFVRPPV